MPIGYYGRIVPRSSISYFMEILGGIIDSDYTKTIYVILRNKTNEIIHYEKGARLVQIIFE